ncbi:MAG: delta-aminolevulinic acid dehydratase [Crocosphaera sp.]|nr:delta-aminolevulinic acid dehydratase [Crocosphaera sp.]
MTLIDSQAFHNLAITLGTSLFAVLVFWAFWYASKMD